VKHFRRRSAVDDTAGMWSDTVIFKVCNINYSYLIYLLTPIGLTASGSSTVHIYAQTIHRTTHLTLKGFLGFEPRVVKLKIKDELTA